MPVVGVHVGVDGLLFTWRCTDGLLSREGKMVAFAGARSERRRRRRERGRPASHHRCVCVRERETLPPS